VNNIAAAFQEPLDSTSDEPLYAQLERRILQLIATGVLDENVPLPTEESLVKTFGLSRATVRRCFKDLVDAGHVRRRRGLGTFVSRQSGQASITRSLNFSSEIRALKMTPSLRVLEFRTIKSSASIAQNLHIAKGANVWRIRRVRLADGSPVLLTTSFVPTLLCPKLSEQDLEHSLYSRITEQSNALPARCEEIYDAVCLDETDAQQLDVPIGSPAFRIHRASMDTRNRVFEISIIIEPASKHRFKVSTDIDEVHFEKIFDMG
jgi:GntR family transcriptional regulator